MRLQMAAEIHIGTSGWTYDGWRGSFYPNDIPKRCWLQHYASVFSSAEINGSFYRTPSLDAVRGWRENTPADFTYAWKASKFITHWKRLNETCVNSIALMETRLRALGHKAVAITAVLIFRDLTRNSLSSLDRSLPEVAFLFPFSWKWVRHDRKGNS